MSHTVTIYSTPTCPFCEQAKVYLTQKGIPFTDKDVSADHAAAQEMIQKSGQMGVPVIDIDGKIIIGFQKEQLDALLS